MKKIILILILLIPINVGASTLPEINSKEFIIYDLTEDEVLAKKNEFEKTSIASLTKIMTVITAIEKIDNLDEKITITSNMLQGIYWNASVAGLKVGDTVTYKDLLYASILPSGADAVNVLAYTLSGSPASYVEEMNKMATKIGLTNTHYTNVIGLDNPNHYSNINDVLTLLKYALKNETFKEIYTTKETYLSNGLLVSSTVSKFNEKMQLDTSRIIGSKTGFTDNAGYCLSSYFKSHDHEIIMITLNAQRIDTNIYHIIDTLNLIEYTDEVIEEKIEEEKQKALELKAKQEQKRNEQFLYYGVSLSGAFVIVVGISAFCKPKRK